MSPSLRRTFTSTLGILAFFLLWGIVSASGLVNPTMFPTPVDVFQSGMSLAKNGELLEHIRASLWRVLLGFAIGSIFGTAFGILLGRSEAIESFVGPVFHMARAIPPLALVPLIIFWFGVSEAAKILLISWAAFFPVWIATLLGVKGTNQLFIRAGRSLGARRWTLLRLIVLPAALASIFSGMRVALSISFTVLVAAELAGALAGLGYLIQISALSFRVDTIFLGIVLLAVLGFFSDLLFMTILYRVFPWYKKEQTAKS